jgi:D-ribose pyranase
MKKKGVLNAQLCRVIAEMGHNDLLLIADAGLPIPQEIERIDLALVNNKPLFKDVFKAVYNELTIQTAYMAVEVKEKNPQALKVVQKKIANLDFISHEELKEKSHHVKAIIRTGECTPYANVILVSGVIF